MQVSDRETGSATLASKGYFRATSVAFWGVHVAAIAGVAYPRVLVAGSSRWPSESTSRECGLVTAGYHRYFAHRSVKTSRVFQFVLAVLGATTMQNGPLWWASVHRRHHKNADGPWTPTRPTKRGFWYAHIGWAFDLTSPYPRDDDSNVADLKYPQIRLIDRVTLAADRRLRRWRVRDRRTARVGLGFRRQHRGGLPRHDAHQFARARLATRRYATADHSRNSVLLAVTTVRRVAQQPPPLPELRRQGFRGGRST